MKKVCVYCGSSDSVNPEYISGARELGRLLAQKGIGLVYGGGKIGLMGAVADGVLEAGGEVHGVIVESMNTPALAHGGLSSLEVTATMQQRKWRMFEKADAFIALPGGYGTFDELFETITWAQIGVHEKPIGLLSLRGYFEPLWKMVKHAEAEGFIYREHADMLCISDKTEDLLDCLANHSPDREAVRRWMRQ